MRKRVDLPAVRTDDADDSAFRYREAQIVNQNAVAVGFAQMADFQNFIAQTRAGGMNSSLSRYVSDIQRCSSARGGLCP